MGLKNLDAHFVFILSIRQTTRIPDVCFAIFTAANDISSVVTEASVDLTAGIFMTPKFHFQ
jgi:hypothetical protein